MPRVNIAVTQIIDDNGDIIDSSPSSAPTPGQGQGQGQNQNPGQNQGQIPALGQGLGQVSGSVRGLGQGLGQGPSIRGVPTINNEKSSNTLLSAPQQDIKKPGQDPLTSIVCEVLWRGNAEMKIGIQSKVPGPLPAIVPVPGTDLGSVNSEKKSRIDFSSSKSCPKKTSELGSTKSRILKSLELGSTKILEFGSIKFGPMRNFELGSLKIPDLGSTKSGPQKIDGISESFSPGTGNAIDQIIEENLSSIKTVSVVVTKVKKSKLIKTALLSTWISIGCTTRRDILFNIGDYKFDIKNNDTSGLYGLPPLWTCRGKNGEKDLATTVTELFQSPGDWLPRNYQSRPKPESQIVGTRRSPLSLHTVTLSIICLLNLQKNVKFKPGLSELRKRKDMWKLLADAQESERRCMAKEEILMRTYCMSEEESKYGAMVSHQVLVAKHFTHLMTLIQRPTRILSRLRFFMGCALDGGGMRVTCQDPSVLTEDPRSILEVYVVPLMYPEDEDEMRKHVEVMTAVNRSQPIVTPIIELSVHDLRGYTAMGSIATDMRTAIILVERYDHNPTLCDVLRGRKKVSDRIFLLILIQILEAVVAVHEEGIIHRNLHANCVYVVKRPSQHSIGLTSGSKNNGKNNGGNSGRNNGKSNSKNSGNETEIPLCRLGDFWFLQNPREGGCSFSAGRADWGDQSTAPPEARGGFKMSCVSDIYAFGLCVLIWAKCINRQEDIDLDLSKDSDHIAKKKNVKIYSTEMMLGIATTDTLSLPPNQPLQNLNNILPSRWGPQSWLQRLLKMCLQEHPKHRANSNEILDYLRSILSDNEHNMYE